jgi:hypothetical protein
MACLASARPSLKRLSQNFRSSAGRCGSMSSFFFQELKITTCRRLENLWIIWEVSRALSATFQVLIEYSIPIWLLLYPEGTRYTKEKHDQSMEFAKEKGLKTLKHLLLPRPKGFHESISCLHNSNVKAVYDCTVGMVIRCLRIEATKWQMITREK